jgi:hypothetical protein
LDVEDTGKPFSAVVLFAKGDLEFMANDVGLPHWSSHEICGLCFANKGHINFKDCRKIAAWRFVWATAGAPPYGALRGGRFRRPPGSFLPAASSQQLLSGSLPPASFPTWVVSSPKFPPCPRSRPPHSHEPDISSRRGGIGKAGVPCPNVWGIRRTFPYQRRERFWCVRLGGSGLDWRGVLRGLSFPPKLKEFPRLCPKGPREGPPEVPSVVS